MERVVPGGKGERPPRVVAIVQARMGSSRLPGKALLPLAGKPVLWHIVHRLRKCRSVDAIAIATTTEPDDDPIAEFGRAAGVAVVRGPEDDVLARYVLAAEQLQADIIVRVTGDAPLIDPARIDCFVSTVVETDADNCVVDPQTPDIHEGFGCFRYRALRKLADEARDDPVAREYITGYFAAHPGFVRTVYAPVDRECLFHRLCTSVDTPADFRFLERVYARLDVPAGEANVRDLVRLLHAEPDLLTINRHVHRKAVSEHSRRVLVRCDGDADLGLGHVVRCLALADELRDRHAHGIVFAMERGSVGFELVRRAGYPIERNQGEEEGAWLDALVHRLQPDALVLDVRSGLTGGNVERLRGDRLLVATVDDESDRRLAADLTFDPPVPQMDRVTWAGFGGQRHAGWEWVVLRREFGEPPSTALRGRPTVLVTMGGSDPAGLTLKAVEALDRLDDDFEVVIVAGPAFSHRAALDNLLRRMRRRFDVRWSVSDMHTLMAQADLAVAAFGVTAYELAATAVPAVYLCLTDDHVESASIFVDAGIAVCLGDHGQVSVSALAAAVKGLLHDRLRRTRMASRARQLVDGRGAARVADALVARMQTARA